VKGTAARKRIRTIGRLAALGLFVAAAAGLAFGGTPEAAGGAAEGAGSRLLSKGTLTAVWLIAPLGSLLGIFFAWFFYQSMKRSPEGTDKMKEIAQAVREGARAYLTRQYKVVALVFGALFVFFGFMAFALGTLPKLVPFAFLTGGFFSGLCGWFGMTAATYASNRTAAGAKESLNRGLQVALRSGAVMGLIVVGLGLFDICAWFAALYWLVPKVMPEWQMPLHDITITMLCFGMGASTQALFARVGGGIFTKAADVGADLVGKVEAGIPEDDPRNPATIADNVGDNVGDVAGMGADLYESYCGSILATAALGVAAFANMKPTAGLTAEAAGALVTNWQLAAIMVPMVVAGLGVALSVLGVFLVRTREDAGQKELLSALNRGVYGSAIGIWVLSYFVIHFLLPGHQGLFLSLTSGLLAGIVIGKATEYYTNADFKPTQKLAEQSLTGPGTLIIDGVAIGMLSTAIPVLSVVAATLVAYVAGGTVEGELHASLGLYGVGLAAVGMLSTLGITLATDAYGPIADNAGGNAEMSGEGPEVRERTDALDSLGNTTAATGKGFAIGSAALTALALLAAYIEDVRNALHRMGRDAVTIGERSVEVAEMNLADFMAYYKVNLMNPKVLMGMFVGAMLAFVFCALTMKAVGRAAGKMVEEVRRQFREIAGIMEGTAKPDYASCVDISTRGAQREMMFPSLLALAVPVGTGLVLGVPGVMGLLAGGLVCGFTLAVFMANAGGAWDNAKKYIEGGKHGGKGSDAHKAAVVGDTVGDPFKDTSGPSLNILIKLMTMVSVVAAGLVVKYAPEIGRFLGLGF